MANSAEVTSLVDKLPDELHSAYFEINKALSREEENKVLARYEIGRQVFAVRRAPRRYGSDAVERLAKALAVSASRLYSYCAVASQWPPVEFGKIADRRDAVRGRPISWSALTEIAGVADSNVQKELIEVVIEEGLSVRELRQRRAELLGHEIADAPTAPRSVVMALGEITKLAHVILQRRDAWEEGIFAALEGLGPEDNPAAVLSQLEQAETAQRELRDHCDEVLEHLAAGREHINGQRPRRRRRRR
jgi:hypothetical protein